MKFVMTAKTFVEVPMGKGKPAKREECFAYATEDGSVRVQFHANPKKAWSYLLVPEGTNAAGAKLAGKLINAWTVKGIEALGRKPVGVDGNEWLEKETHEITI